MKIEHTHDMPTIEGGTITFHLRNTMRQDIRYAAYRARFAKDQPDEGMRDDFCYLWARVVKAEGFKCRALDEGSTLEDFERVYYGLAEKVNHLDFLAAANAAAAMKKNTDTVEKPDEELTPDEAADPNS